MREHDAAATSPTAGNDAYCRVVFAAGGNLDTFEHSGFSYPETGGCWSLGRISRLRLPAPRRPGGVELLLTVHPVQGTIPGVEPTIAISVNGTPLSHLSMAGELSLRVALPHELLRGHETILLQFAHPVFVTGAPDDKAGEARQLAVFFEQLELRSIEGPVITPDVPTVRSEAALEPPYVSDAARLGFGRTQQVMRIFEAAQVPKPAPLLNPERLSPEFLAEHTRYRPPGATAAYAVPGHELWGNGLLVREGRIFLSGDCFPGYLAASAAKGVADFPQMWKGALGRQGAETLVSGQPLAVLVHPNLVYGHFLLEILPRLYQFSLLRSWGCQVRPALSARMADWVRAFVRLYCDDDEVFWYDHERHRVVAPSFVVPSMMQVDHHLHPAFNLMVTDLLARVGVLPITAQRRAPAGRRLYLTRTAMPGPPRLLNEPEVERTMAALGFAIVHPEQMPLADQLRLYASADVIAGEFSSALHNAMFMAPGTGVIAINFFNAYQSGIARVRRQHIAFVPPDDGIFRHWRLTADRPRVFNVNCDELRQTTEAMLAVLQG
jgi:hypothetical protein